MQFENSTQLLVERSVLDAQPLSKCGLQLIKLVKAGAFATVCLARNEHNETFALKVIRKDQLKKVSREKFLPRELKILATLNHEHTVRVYQIIETRKHVYIVMEFFERDVAQVLRTEKRLAEAKARKWLWQLVSAITYLHSRGIAHRDLKCENMMLDKNDRIRVIDFGFSNFCDANKLSETFCGTTSYAAPEILAGVAYDPFRSDLWSTGVVLYEMVVGHEPFSIPLNFSLLWMANQIRDLRFSNVEVSNSLRQLLRGLLRFEKKRFGLSEVRTHDWLRDSEQLSLSHSLSLPRGVCLSKTHVRWDEPVLQPDADQKQLALTCGNVTFALCSPAWLFEPEAARCTRARVRVIDVTCCD